VIRGLYLLSDRLRQRARRRSWDPGLALGRDAEDLAHRHLQRQGLVVVARNWRTPSGSGEIDLVAREGDTLVFVEVKARSSDEIAAPDRAMDVEKLRRLRRAAEHYLAHAKHDRKLVRLDLVSVVFGASEPLTHIRDAYPLLS
jgi:putative endonuclease